MKIRRYMAKNTQEAILKVKMDLGSEALILNTRKVKQKGLLGLFAKPMVEVLAAVDEYNGAKTESDAQKPAGKPANTSESGDKINFDKKEEKIANLENKISSMEEIIQKIYQQMQTGEKPKIQAPQVSQAPPPQQVRQVPAGDRLAEDRSEAYSKILGMFYSNLIKNEVDADIAKKMVDTAASRLGPAAGVNDAAAQLSGILSGILGKPETIRPGMPGKPTVVIFVGPTGVGKTTTLAKIAANYLLNQKKSVGLITADTYRIAAVEQLKTYAEILGIPVSVVYTAADMKEAIGQHADKEIVLIDTAGRSHRNKAQFEELKSLIAASGADDVYLVLSATTSIRNCREILNSYEFLHNYKLIFTKTDEAPVQGIILNVKYLTGKSLSYITTGQSVPDDIETANIEKITKNLIGSVG
jgi:flagellar biosynthesis protein FlhF